MTKPTREGARIGPHLRIASIALAVVMRAGGAEGATETAQTSAASADLPIGIEMDVGQRREVTLANTATRIDVKVPGIAELYMPDPRTLTVFGVRTGSTTLEIVYADGAAQTVTVLVAGAAESPVMVLAGLMRESLATLPGIEVSIRDAVVVISGTARTSERDFIRERIDAFPRQTVDEVRYVASAPDSAPKFTNVGTADGEIQAVPELPHPRPDDGVARESAPALGER